MGPSRYHHLISLLLALGPASGEASDALRHDRERSERPRGQTKRTILNSSQQPRGLRQKCRIGCFFFLFSLGTQAQESPRVISTARLNVSPRLHLPPIDVVVFNDPQGDLILWLASRLDAFSAYPYQTRLPGGAPGGTTGRPEVCPSRSSRTSDRATQISDAHNR